MPSLIVVGAQWGDEGKGKVVHFLSRRATHVVRYQGGPNAGHTVIFDGKPFALHLIPTGALFPGVKNVVGNGVVLDPRAFREEAASLEKRGIRLKGRVWVSLGAHVILPYHIRLDTLRESGGLSLGTTRRGIGPCYMDKVGRIGIRVADYLDPPLFRELLDRNLKWHGASLRAFGPLSALRKENLGEYAPLRRFLRPLCADTALLIQRALRRGGKVLFEGAQGVMLDLDFGTYPFVTSSSPVAGGACAGAGVGPTQVGEVLGVAKAYTTRVGLGPFPTEMQGPVAHYIREKGGEYGATTGRPRRIGWLDVVQLRHAVSVSGIGGLALTKMDTLSHIHPLKVCVAYRHGGKVLREFPASRRVQMEAEPVYETLRGFTEDISRVSRFRDFPRAVREYIRRVEGWTGVPVRLVSVGRGREATIVLGRKSDWFSR